MVNNFRQKLLPSKPISKCPEERFWFFKCFEHIFWKLTKFFIFRSDSERKNSAGFLKTALYVSWWPFWVQKNQKVIETFHCFGLWAKQTGWCSGVVKTAFYVSRGAFWVKIFFWKFSKLQFYFFPEKLLDGVVYVRNRPFRLKWLWKQKWIKTNHFFGR